HRGRPLNRYHTASTVRSRLLPPRGCRSTLRPRRGAGGQVVPELDHAQPEGGHSDARAVVHAQLPVDTAHVVLDSVRADIEGGGDLPIGQTVGQELENLPLPGRQILNPPRHPFLFRPSLHVRSLRLGSVRRAWLLRCPAYGIPRTSVSGLNSRSPASFPAHPGRHGRMNPGGTGDPVTWGRSPGPRRAESAARRQPGGWCRAPVRTRIWIWGSGYVFRSAREAGEPSLNHDVSGRPACLYCMSGGLSWLSDQRLIFAGRIARVLGPWSQTGSLHQALAQGEDRRLGPVLDAQFGQEVGDVVLHRLLGDEELLGNLAVGLA